jgi:hypothetical protein
MPELLRRGQGFGRLGIGVPYYKACYKFFRWWSWVLVGGLEEGDILLNDNSYPRPVPIPLGHNMLAKRFLETDADTLCIVEDDHAGQQDTIRRLRTKPENLEFDIVCATYVNRHSDLTPVGCNFSGGVSSWGEYEMTLAPLAVAEHGTQEYDVAALGCVLVRRWVLEAMRGDAEMEDWFPFDWWGRNSQDVVFYHRARQVGARVGVDRDTRLIHVGEADYTMEQFYAERERQLRQKRMAEVTNG